MSKLCLEDLLWQWWQQWNADVVLYCCNWGGSWADVGWEPLVHSLCPEKPVINLRQCCSSKIFSFEKKNLLIYCFSSLQKKGSPFFCSTFYGKGAAIVQLWVLQWIMTIYTLWKTRNLKSRMHCNLRASLRFLHTALSITTLDKQNITIHSLSSNKMFWHTKIAVRSPKLFSKKSYFTFFSLYSLVPNQCACGGFVGVILIIFCLGEVFVCPNYG